MIAIADTSPLGWLAANEYAGCVYASNEADARKIEEAEKRAQRKYDKQKKEDGGWRQGSRASGGGGNGSWRGWRDGWRRSRSRGGDVSVKKEKEGSRSRSREQVKGKESRECWMCNKVGHLSFLCPERKRKRT